MGMRVLVTGNLGFIGSHLVPRLIEQGHEVFGLERYVTGRYTQFARDVTTLYADITDFHSTRQAVAESRPDILIHLAAISANSYAYNHPHEVLNTNYLGTVNLAEACMRELPSFQHFLYAGSSEEYGSNPNPPFTEESQVLPHSPYAVAKVASDLYLRYLYRAYGFPATVLRNFNTYGRKDNKHFAVEKVVTQALQGNEIHMGDPTPVRDFMYVDDHVDAYLTVMAQREKALGEVFNFCTGIPTTIARLMGLVVELTGFEGKMFWKTIPTRPLDIKVLVGNATKAQTTLGWKAKYELSEGLKRTIEFWRNK